jgi:hypothetical protein
MYVSPSSLQNMSLRPAAVTKVQCSRQQQQQQQQPNKRHLSPTTTPFLNNVIPAQRSDLITNRPSQTARGSLKDGHASQKRRVTAPTQLQHTPRNAATASAGFISR